MPQSHHAPAPESTSDAGAWFCSGSTTFGTILSEKAGNERSLQNARPLLALSNTIYQTPEPHFRRRRLILFGIWQPTPHIVQNFFLLFIIYRFEIVYRNPKPNFRRQRLIFSGIQSFYEKAKRLEPHFRRRRLILFGIRRFLGHWQKAKRLEMNAAYKMRTLYLKTSSKYFMWTSRSQKLCMVQKSHI